MSNKKKYKYPIWVWIIFSLIMFINFVLSPIATPIWIIIFIIIKKYFIKWSLKINKSPLIPFFVIAVIGLAGFLLYYLYYRLIKRNIKRKKIKGKK